MNTDWAAEQLQTIRTLMERSALYRRALAPVMTLAGAVAVVAGVAGWRLGLNTHGAFALHWMAVALAAMILTMLLIRRQAFRAGEPFWSLPTRKVAQAAALPLTAGAATTLLFLVLDLAPGFNSLLAVLWLLFYGFALNAAGFFMRRSIRLFGWLMAVYGMILGFALFADNRFLATLNPHLLMGGLFGVPHLAYGAYLYLTEKPAETA